MKVEPTRADNINIGDIITSEVKGESKDDGRGKLVLVISRPLILVVPCSCCSLVLVILIPVVLVVNILVVIILVYLG